MNILIQNAEIISDGKREIKDILISNEKIVEIGTIKPTKNDRVYNAKGLYAIPGGIDPHTHFQMDLSENLSTIDDFPNGTKAAICGGTTTIIDFAEVSKGEALINGINIWNNKANNNSYCDYSYHMTIVEVNEKTEKEIIQVIENGVTSFKIYMAYKDIMQLEDENIYKVLNIAKKLNVRVSFHCENGDLVKSITENLLINGKNEAKYHPISRPNLVEKEAISRVVDIAKLVSVPIYIVHLSTKEGLEVVRAAKLAGVDIIAETCIQYLLLDTTYYNDRNLGPQYILSPPLRSLEDVNAMWEGIANNDIQIVATDHCSFNLRDKNMWKENFSKVPNGLPGVEERIKLLYTYGVVNKKISLEKMVEIISTNPAKVFGLYPKKGTISVGSDADIVLINPNIKSIISTASHNSLCDYNPYENFEINCEISTVFLRGGVIVKKGKLIKNQYNGKFLSRKTL